jgi:hypothetical protein
MSDKKKDDGPQFDEQQAVREIQSQFPKISQKGLMMELKLRKRQFMKKQEESASVDFALKILGGVWVILLLSIFGYIIFAISRVASKLD